MYMDVPGCRKMSIEIHSNGHQRTPTDTRRILMVSMDVCPSVLIANAITFILALTILIVKIRQEGP